ncbi:MAG: folylpolyglutamate synthase/dihydrofolate synthase family protein, partial [Oscillospiraceae bacterium]
MSSHNSFSAATNPSSVRMLSLLKALGSPQNTLKFIHVAGTNGKGSVCSILAEILTKSKYKTGKFTSPHLIKPNERISIDGENISNNDLNRLLATVTKTAESIENCTLFEIYLGVSLLYFFERHTDIVILETGLGGRLDATNVIKNPLLSIITKIALDHQAYLGNTLKEIATEKAGIIKENSKTLVLTQAPEVLDVFITHCAKKSSSLIVTGPLTLESINGYHEIFSYSHLKNLECGLGGVHQPYNAALAIESAFILKNLGYIISDDDIRYGVLNAKNIGRFEVLSNSPITIFDGGHNTDGILSLHQSIKRYFKSTSVSYLVGMMKDKDINEMLDALADKDATFYPVSVPNYDRALDIESLGKAMKNHG